MASRSARSVSHGAGALHKDSFASSHACLQIVVTAIVAGVLHDSGMATAAGRPGPSIHHRIGGVDVRAGGAAHGMNRGIVWRPDCSTRSAAAKMRSRTSAGMAVDACVMVSFLE